MNRQRSNRPTRSTKARTTNRASTRAKVSSTSSLGSLNAHAASIHTAASRPATQAKTRVATTSSARTITSSAAPSASVATRRVPVTTSSSRGFFKRAAIADTRDTQLFSSIDANVDRNEQALKYPLSQLTHLQNGLRVASEHQNSDLATVGVFVDAGTRYETEENNGVAHFLEHTLFKGTNKRSRTQLEMEIENMGGSLNAYTSREQTVFTATVLKKNVKDAVEILGDIILNSKITQQAIENERSVIIAEAKSIEENMQETVFDRMHAFAFQGSSLALNILGPEKNIMSINKNDIDTYVKTHYTAPRMAVVGVGDLDHGEFTGLVEKHFSGLPSTPVNGIKPNKGVPFFTGGYSRLREDHMDTAHVAVGYETAGWNDPDHYALMTLQMMIGNFHQDRLTDMYSSSYMVKFAAQADLAQSIAPFNTIYSDTGIFGLYATAGPMSLDIMSRHMMRAFTHHMTDVSAQILDEAKAKLKLSILSQYEGTETTANELGRQLLSHNRRIHPTEVMARIDAVDEIAVQNVAKRFFHDQELVVTAIGPIFELPDYNFMRKFANPKYM